MKPRSIKFIIEKSSRVPKEINKEKTIYAVFSPEKAVINPGETIFIHTKFSVTYPNDLLTTFIIMPKLQEEGLKLIGQNNEQNPKLQEEGLKLIGQSNEQNQRVRLEYFNPTFKKFTIKKI